MSNGDWEHRIEKIEDTTNKIQSDVKEIKLALAGSEKIGLKGFAKRMDEAEGYITKDKRQKWFIAGAMTAIASASGAFWSKIFG